MTHEIFMGQAQCATGYHQGQATLPCTDGATLEKTWQNSEYFLNTGLRMHFLAINPSLYKADTS